LKRAVLIVLLWAASGPGNALEAQTRARTPDDYDEVFRKYSKRFFGPGFDWQYFKAQGMAESNLVPSARSRVGATGLMQLMPSTYKAIQTNNPELKAIDDPESNIAAGIMYNRDLWRRYEDHTEEERLRFMFGGYNAGPGTMRRAKSVARTEQLDEFRWQSVQSVAPRVQRWRYRETLFYVARIEDTYRALRTEPSRANALRAPPLK
jgi:membrane-bound lytic murein transglycosylase MltF